MPQPQQAIKGVIEARAGVELVRGGFRALEGPVRTQPPFVQLRERGSRGLRSRADGMAIDAGGRVYVATASGVQVISRRGQYLGTIRVPSTVRNLAFAGPTVKRCA